ncbi:MAG: hypothetical protein AB8D78_09785 [Akkermansiaceae bacterium]
MTIIAIGGLTLLLVALVTVISLERKTARSYSEFTRAEFAVESGYSAALDTIAKVVVRDDALVFRLEDPLEPTVFSDERPLGFREQFFTYGAVFENNSWNAIPFFSAAEETDIGTTRPDASVLNVQLEDYVQDIETLGRITEHDQNIPRAQWVEIPADPTVKDDYTLRYAFWVEDLGGRIPGKSAGKQARGEGLSTEEIDFSTILDPSADSGTIPDAMADKRESIPTAGSLRHLVSEGQAKRIEPYIHYYNTTSPIEVPKRIPRGFGYQDAGELAPDLNEFVEDKDVEGIADHIARNLPDFSERKGGFPATEDYLKTLAASIIDYADIDSDATTGTGYRGVDSYPFVNELFDRYEWVGGTSDTVKIEVETYVELWNPSNQEVTGDVSFINENKHKIRVPPLSAQEFEDSETFEAPDTEIPANGFVVISLGVTEYEFPASSSFPPSELIFNTTYDSNFSLSWNGSVVDFARGGLQRTSGNLRNGFSRRKWKGNSSPALDVRIGQAGDPRASYYIDTWVYANSYDDNSNWGGRVLKRDISNSNYNEVRLQEWPDSGTNSEPGIDSGTDARIPTDTKIILKSSGAAIAGKDFPANEPDLAPAMISNEGRYQSLAELGNIFDPAQFTDVNSAFPVGNSRSGGGFSLAIGRPEFGAFDKEGQRSAQLLDLFSIEPDPTASPTTNIPINMNTAPREVLRSLVAGMTLDGDPATVGVVPPKENETGDIFADFVIAQRSKFPLRSLSDLNNIRKTPAVDRDPTDANHAPFFGSRDAYTPGTEPVESWDDAGREELFRKTMNLVDFKSNTFRVVVAAEARDPNGLLKGRAAREFHITLRPKRDPADGSIATDANGNTILEITKHYEKSL